MSADNALFVQLNKKSEFVVQYGSMSADELPDPEKARPEDTFRNIPDFVNAKMNEANMTEYGFQFFLENSLRRPLTE